jgi:hypothetical protein
MLVSDHACVGNATCHPSLKYFSVAELAQMVEHWDVAPGVTGSIPVLRPIVFRRIRFKSTALCARRTRRAG